MAIKSHIGDDVSMMAVVKADAYGHGALTVAKATLEHWSRLFSGCGNVGGF